MSNVIYRHLATEQYRPKTKATLNKRSELIKVYNNIVNISKQSPLYMFHVDQESQNYAIQIKESAMELRSFISNINSGGMSEIFQSKRAVSSDDSSVSAEILTDDYSALPAAFHLKVNQLATAQVNIGRETENGNFAIKEGEHIITAHVHDSTYEFKYHIEPRTTNRAVQVKLADSINRSKSGLQAQVVTGRNSNLSKLLISSLATGSPDDNPVFSFTDKSSPSNSRAVVEYFDLNEITKQAVNSKFELNDVPKESMSNSFSFNKSLKITLRSVTDEAVNIGYETDSSQIMALLKAAAAMYNDFIDTAKDALPSQKRAEVLIHDFSKILSEHKEELESAGLSVSDDNLAVNDAVAEQAAKDGTLEHLLTSEDSVFSLLGQKAALVTINPMHYVDKTLVTYPNHTRTPYPNPYITSIYSGMLCNCYC